MEIAILRHGKPDFLPENKISAYEFYNWIQSYNASKLSDTSKPAKEVVAYALQCEAIVCSALPRSVDSAKALGEEKIVLSDPIFNEAELPSSEWQYFKLSPNLWAGIFRVLWLFGYAAKSESIMEAKQRALVAVSKLEEVAQKHKKIIFVGHGVFNRLLAKEFKNRGWLGPKNPGSKYWEFSVYKR